MLQVGEIAPIKADDPVHCFYLLYVTKEQEIIKEMFKDGYGHKYYPGSKIIRGKYLEIFKEDKETTKYYLDQKEAAVFILLSYRNLPRTDGRKFLYEKKVSFWLFNGKYVERKFKRSEQYLRRQTANLLFY